MVSYLVYSELHFSSLKRLLLTRVHIAKLVQTGSVGIIGMYTELLSL